MDRGRYATSEKLKKCLVVVYSYHHGNTLRVADAIAEVLDATVRTPHQVSMEELKDYELIGFGSGIDSGRHYMQLLDFVELLPNVYQKRSFIFSTSAVQGENKVQRDHQTLREKLVSKGYDVVGEFSCVGFNTNSILRFLGGMNKGRPNDIDLKNAAVFARQLSW